jgi:uncharacterized protein (DUF58 family)
MPYEECALLGEKVNRLHLSQHDYNRPMLSEAFLRSLRNLRLNSPRRRTGSTTGERRSVRRGRSVEFADYRNYTPGDDPRRVDWNIYARLERPFIKLFEDEEDLATHILLDNSPSMRWQDEDEAESSKWQRAAELAIAFGYIALVSGDKLIVETSDGKRFGPRRSVAVLGELVKFVEQAEIGDRRLEIGARVQSPISNPQSLSSWLKRYALTARSGFCIVISDLMDEGGYEDGLNALGHSRLDVHVLHTLCPAELDPQFVGDLRLKDVETTRTQDLSLDEAVLSQYRERLNAWTSDANAFCRKRGGRYHLTDTSTPIQDILLKDLRKEEWLI